MQAIGHYVSLPYAPTIQELINTNQSILGYEVVGVDGCQPPYSGTIKELTIQEHSLLGRMVKVWVEWDWKLGHLTPYFPREFSKWENGKGLGVYYKGAN